MNKRVFLIGDIGRDENGYLHIGDEAMWLRNVFRYKEMGWKISASGRSSSASVDGVRLVQDIRLNSLEEYEKALANPNSDHERIISTIRTSDLVHISGGGNLNSLWPGHLYYRLFIIHMCKKFDKKIIATSQTIGPLNKSDSALLAESIQYISHIGIRDRDSSYQYLVSSNYPTNRIIYTADDSINPDWLYNCPVENYIGMSLHADLAKNSTIMNTFRAFSETNLCKAIPHVIYADTNEMSVFDFLVSDEIDSKVDLKGLIESSIQKTQAAQFNIVSRYHAAVFSLMANRPTICLSMNDYYDTKFKGILAAFDIPASISLLRTEDFGQLSDKIKGIESVWPKQSVSYLYGKLSRLETNLKSFQ